MINLLVLCGGQSPEHEISIRSTKNILAAIDATNYTVTIIGISKSGRWHLIDQNELGDRVEEKGNPVFIRPGQRQAFLMENGGALPSFDVVFPVLHGPNGEDGTIQGLLRLLDIPFVGPGVLGSAICMDKEVTKRLLKAAGIGVAQWITLRQGDAIPDYETVAEKLGAVVFVKPANMGSSVGVHRVDTKEAWDHAIQDALTYDRKVLVEQAINGRELECAVMGNDAPQASGVGEVRSGSFYSYEEKYASSSHAEIIIPAEVTATELAALQQTALATYRILECTGMARVDMFLTPEGGIYVNEVNTIPGFTHISMYPKLWEHSGMEYSALIDRLIALAMEGRL